MNRRITGVLFCFISAFLYATHYLVSAIYGSSYITLERKDFSVFLDDIGNGLMNASILSLIVGILYLVYAEFESMKKD